MIGGNTKEVKDQTIKLAKQIIEKAKITLRKQRHDAQE